MSLKFAKEDRARKASERWKPGVIVKPKIHTGDESLAKQEFREQSDLNWLAARYLPQGVPPMSPQQISDTILDVSQIPDFAELQRKMISAREAFAALPPLVRARFENQPHKLVEFIQDDRNYDEAVKLGLVIKKEDPPPPQKQEGAKPEGK